MAKIKLTCFLATILIAIFILDSFSLISASLSPGVEKYDSSWFCGGKSRKMYSDCWKSFRDFKVPALDGVRRLREAAAALRHRGTADHRRGSETLLEHYDEMPI